MTSVLVKGGRVCNADLSFEADVLIEDGVIRYVHVHFTCHLNTRSGLVIIAIIAFINPENIGIQCRHQNHASMSVRD